MSDQAIKIPSVVTVKELADLLERSVNDVISTLVRYGVMANINEDIDFDTASIVADDLGIEIVEEKQEIPTAEAAGQSKDAQSRPAVVTIMGHVDHGKTTLLDTIRSTNVAAGESGGITQAISSYQVSVTDPEDDKKQRTVTFVDTPGHSAFEAMRKHGVSITDLVVLVVAANEGVKPQTKEAIKHILAMKAPVIVAISKIDLPNADIAKVKRELADNQILSEEWGGKVPVVPISATKNEGVDKLLEVILLATDILELKADYDAPAAGVVIESHMESGLGPIATVLIQNGTLNQGQIVVIGASYGKIRSLEDFRGKRIKLATAATPVRIAGLSTVPNFGERLMVVADEKEARLIARQNGALSQRGEIAKRAAEISKASKKIEGRVELSLVIKADTQGSLNAIVDLINNLSNEDVAINVIKADVGEVGLADLERARAASGVVIVFNTKILASVKKMAQESGVSLHSFKIIYELEQLIVQTVNELMPEIEEEKEVAVFEILKRFRDNRKHPVLGGLLKLGKLAVNQKVVINHGTEEIGKGEIVTLQIGQESVDEVKEGRECGLEVKITEGDPEVIKEKDKVRVVTVERVKKTA